MEVLPLDPLSEGINFIIKGTSMVNIQIAHEHRINSKTIS